MADMKTWVLDPTHSELLFKVKHLMITNVKGEFTDFNAEIKAEGNDFENAKVKATIKGESVYTNNNDRDKHLKSEDFFNVENFEELTFEGTSFEKLDDEHYKLKGDLTIVGVTKPVALDVEFGGTAKDPWGNEKAGFSISGKINRKDWGLNWNSTLETGGVLVSDEVKIMAEVQFTPAQ
tara:strand:- start:176069 stop:176605 length:537 start_codon:yes stop_codon:yes gene_type:complete